MISTPSLLEQFGAAADEKNYFLYMILDQGMGKKPGKGKHQTQKEERPFSKIITHHTILCDHFCKRARIK